MASSRPMIPPSRRVGLKLNPTPTNRASTDYLPLRVELIKRNIQVINLLCPMCEEHIETIVLRSPWPSKLKWTKHALFGCLRDR